MKTKKLLDKEQLDEILNYNSETGIFTWKKCGRISCVNKPAGYVHPRGYVHININGSIYKAHRLAWLMFYGEDPENLFIDHINRDRSDNRICNLRLATNQQNQGNRKCKGFSWDKKSKKWAARIKVNGKSKYLGAFECPLLARLAYEKAVQIHFGEFGNC